MNHLPARFEDCLGLCVVILHPGALIRRPIEMLLLLEIQLAL